MLSLQETEKKADFTSIFMTLILFLLLNDAVQISFCSLSSRYALCMEIAIV